MTHRNDTVLRALPFILKLYKLLNDPEFRHVVTWGPRDQGLIILNKRNLERQVLRQTFRTRKYESFLRQLNAYGFQRTTIAGRPNIKFYDHPLFLRDGHDMLHKIRREGEENTDEEVVNEAPIGLQTAPHQHALPANDGSLNAKSGGLWQDQDIADESIDADQLSGSNSEDTYHHCLPKIVAGQ